MAYSISIFSKNYKTQRGTDGTLTRALTHATRISVRRDLNQPERITFQVPRGGDDAAALELGRVVRVLDGTNTVASGIIVGPLDKTRSMIEVTVAGKAELLNWAITPYEFELEGDTAEAQVRELLKNYRFFRQNTPADFNAGTLTDTEVLTIAGSQGTGDSYFVTLNKTNEIYAVSGTYISQPILCTDNTLGDPDDITRLRYLAELGNDTEISVAFRHSNDAASGTPSNWSAWSSEYDLGTQNTENLGLTGYSISTDFRWIQVRFSLATADDSITPALQSFEIVCEYPSEITAGSIDLPGPKLNKTFSTAPHHQAIREIVSARNAEFRVNDNYEIDIAKRLGDTTPTATFEVGANCNVVRYQQEDRRLSNEIWSFGREGDGITQTFERSQADPEIENYGQRPWIYVPIATDSAERTQEISDELDLRKQPAIAATLEELSATALSVEIGDIVNFEYDARGIDTTLRVIAIHDAAPQSGTPRRFELKSHEGFFGETDTQSIESMTGATGTEDVAQTLSWNPIPPLSVYLDDAGTFSGTVLNSISRYLDNPSGVDIVYSVPSKTNGINSATLNATNDLSVSVTGVVGNSLNENVIVRAVGTINGTPHTVNFTIQIDLVFPSAADPANQPSAAVQPSPVVNASPPVNPALPSAAVQPSNDVQPSPVVNASPPVNPALPSAAVQPSNDVQPSPVVNASAAVQPNPPQQPSASVQPSNDVQPSPVVNASAAVQPNPPQQPSASVQPSNDVQPSPVVNASAAVQPNPPQQPSAPQDPDLPSAAVQPSNDVQPSPVVNASAAVQPNPPQQPSAPQDPDLPSAAVQPSNDVQPSPVVNASPPQQPEMPSPAVQPSAVVNASASVQPSAPVESDAGTLFNLVAGFFNLTDETFIDFQPDFDTQTLVFNTNALTSAIASTSGTES